MKQSIFRLYNGFTLLEVIIAMFIMVIGLLGLASLQGLALKRNVNAYHQTVATQLGNQVVENLRSNPRNVATYISQLNTINLSGGGQSAAADGGSAVGSCLKEGCSNLEMIQYEAFVWKKSIASELPDGDITITPRAAGLHEIKISWSEAAERQQPKTHQSGGGANQGSESTEDNQGDAVSPSVITKAYTMVVRLI